MTMARTMTQVAARESADPEAGHRFRIRILMWLGGLALFALFVYGFDYYWSSQVDRALSPKHAFLKPGGTIGLRLGMLGFVLCLLVYLYPLRKRWAWLARQGVSRHWLDYHGLLGIAAPLVITFHSSFKSSGFAGIAYWLMIAVALSGLAGRYLYAQIPPTLNAAERSLEAGQEEMAALTAQLARHGVLSAEEVEVALRPPNVHRAGEMSLLAALAAMIAFDVLFPFRVWRLRRTLNRRADVHAGELDRAIALARSEAQLKKKVAFLAKSQQLLHLWHVVHRPFSASFALLASIHVVLMLMLGYY